MNINKHIYNNQVLSNRTDRPIVYLWCIVMCTFLSWPVSPSIIYPLISSKPYTLGYREVDARVDMYDVKKVPSHLGQPRREEKDCNRRAGQEVGIVYTHTHTQWQVLTQWALKGKLKEAGRQAYRECRGGEGGTSEGVCGRSIMRMKWDDRCDN